MDFKAHQQVFMDYIRNPENPLPKGIAFERMQVYRELFFNNVFGFVSNGFPVLKSLYSANQWLDLVQAFFSQHDCQSPIFIDIAGEFLHFLQFEYQQKEDDPQFMLELAHYEWLELVVATAKAEPKTQSTTPRDIKTAILSFSISARVAQYHYPVHQISPDFRPSAPLSSPVFFCLYQDEDCDVTFLQLTPLSAQVLGYIAQEGRVEFAALIDWLNVTYPEMDKTTLVSGCLPLVEQLVGKGVLAAH
ncbi:HvfC family RiPP maturation protein [Shewanella acanthi]|uniref:HvfC family RiPP maturation protein n=1 Tax=Shewanella acanthi TaxID=2864212 RepID=UPI001C65CFB3|nr:putative DNA-binding domain-containing protein [Shewanella acanthi]QYJ80621.1 putative DNA-binding domain-containing protein [Shewanella acanthi]